MDIRDVVDQLGSKLDALKTSVDANTAAIADLKSTGSTGTAVDLSPVLSAIADVRAQLDDTPAATAAAVNGTGTAGTGTQS